MQVGVFRLPGPAGRCPSCPVFAHLLQAGTADQYAHLDVLADPAASMPCYIYGLHTIHFISPPSRPCFESTTSAVAADVIFYLSFSRIPS